MKGDILFDGKENQFYILGYCNYGYVAINLQSGQFFSDASEDERKACGRLTLFLRSASITINQINP
jgi:hypothetical protein